MSKRHPKIRLEWTNGTTYEALCDREVPPNWDAAMDAAFDAYHAVNDGKTVSAPVTRVEYVVRWPNGRNSEYGEREPLAREMLSYHRNQASDYGWEASAYSLIKVTTTITEESIP